MKVYIGNYPNRLICRLHSNYMNKKYNYVWRKNITKFEQLLEKLENSIQFLYDILNKIYFDKKTQKVFVKIHPWDVYSADVTLSYIILPILKKLKEDKHSSSFVDNQDVPEHLHPLQKEQEFFKENGIDSKWHDRWNYVLDEMIWAFEQKQLDWENEYHTQEGFNSAKYKVHQERITNGFRLFGKYYESLWS